MVTGQRMNDVSTGSHDSRHHRDKGLLDRHGISVKFRGKMPIITHNTSKWSHKLLPHGSDVWLACFLFCQQMISWAFSYKSLENPAWVYSISDTKTVTKLIFIHHIFTFTQVRLLGSSTPHRWATILLMYPYEMIFAMECNVTDLFASPHPL